MRDIREFSPIVLAYIGDAVYELYMRTKMVDEGIAFNIKDLHSDVASRVNAGAQARALARIEPILSEEEWEVVRRGRNAKGRRGPASARVTDYRRSTGFEALLGHLYLTQRYDRLLELMRVATGEDSGDGGCQGERS
ncbi:MAG TPA: ribonuclease III [Firmicutes bacterium]|nr:ribonuclease III [Bacillota bacterium]